MTNIAHIIEVATLLLAAYLLGCITGYGLHRLAIALRTPRPLRQTAPVSVVAAAPRPQPSPAARLAMAAGPDELAPVTVAVVAPAPKPKPPAQPRDPQPKALTAPHEGGKDNLQQIKGIGPKIEATLNGLGIYHFDQLAAWTKANGEWMDAKLGFKGRVAREDWVAQAKALAKAPVAVVKPVRKRAR